MTLFGGVHRLDCRQKKKKGNIRNGSRVATYLKLSGKDYRFIGYEPTIQCITNVYAG